MKTSLTVFFEDPFWVGVFDCLDDGKLYVCRVTFGAEPKDYDVWEFVLQHYDELAFSPTVETETRQMADNSKRRLRNATTIVAVLILHAVVHSKGNLRKLCRHAAQSCDPHPENCARPAGQAGYFIPTFRSETP